MLLSSVFILRNESFIYGILVARRPVKIETRNVITAKARKTIRKVFPISRDTPAIPFAPKTNATIANIKNVIAAWIIFTSVQFVRLKCTYLLNVKKLFIY